MGHAAKTSYGGDANLRIHRTYPQRDGLGYHAKEMSFQARPKCQNKSSSGGLSKFTVVSGPPTFLF